MAAFNKALAVFFMAAIFLTSAEALTCGDVQSRVAPCAGYITGGSSSPSQSCCSGLRSVLSLSSRQDRQTACNCLKSVSRGYAGSSRASSLLGRCGVSGGYSIGPNVDCSRIG